MKSFRTFRPVCLLIALLSAVPAKAFLPSARSIQMLAEWLPASPSYQGYDRSVFYIRFMDEQALWDEIKYACMIVVDESPSQEGVLITYWPLPQTHDWVKEEEQFLNAFARRSVTYPYYKLVVSRLAIPILREGYAKKINSHGELTRAGFIGGGSPMKWQGVLCWGNSYFMTGSNIQKPTGTLDLEYRVYPTPLNQLVVGLLKTVVADGMKRGAFKQLDSNHGVSKGRR